MPPWGQMRPSRAVPRRLQVLNCIVLTLGVAMSALGHKRTYGAQKGMSALPPKADMCSARADVSFVPIADMAHITRLAMRAPCILWPSRCGFRFAQPTLPPARK